MRAVYPILLVFFAVMSVAGPFRAGGAGGLIEGALGVLVSAVLFTGIIGAEIGARRDGTLAQRRLLLAGIQARGGGGFWIDRAAGTVLELRTRGRGLSRRWCVIVIADDDDVFDGMEPGARLAVTAAAYRISTLYPRVICDHASAVFTVDGSGEALTRLPAPRRTRRDVLRRAAGQARAARAGLLFATADELQTVAGHLRAAEPARDDD